MEKPRGIDGRFRRRLGLPPPQHRLWSNKKTAPPLTVSSSCCRGCADLDLVMMHNRRYCAEIGHDVSTQNRKAIVERAMQLNERH